MGRGSNRAKGNARPAAVRKSQKHEDGRVRDLEKRLTEALQRETEGLKREAEAQEQQAATAEILRVISSSPTDVQPVFDVIVRSAVRLCDGLHAAVFRFDGQLVHLAAHHNVTPEALVEFERVYPLPPSRESLSARAILDRSVVHVPDVERDPDASSSRRLGQATGYRSVLSVPMLRDGIPIGGISVGRAQVGPFSDRQIDLVKTFADQAVIAIENVRLFTELQTSNRDLTESLERQTATSEILRVISRSPTDVQPVFGAIVGMGVRLCQADFAMLARYDGTSMSVAAHSGATDEEIDAVGQVYPTAPTPETLGGRTILERTVVYIPDVSRDPTYGPHVIKDAGWRTGLGVPLLREDEAIGAVGMWRRDVRPFTDRQIELLKTFAGQAVIAIENVRLFKELQEKNKALTQAHAQVTEALEQQTATGEILRLIAGSPTDLESVLGTVAETAARVCGARDAIIYRCDGDVLRLACTRGPLPGSPSSLALPLNEKTVTGRSVVERRTIHVHDLAAVAASEYPEALSRGVAAGSRTVLATPLLQEGEPLGAILIRRGEVQAFTEKQIALLETFADQAVIAIENVRLFTELQTRTQELTRSVSELRALGEVGQAISSTLNLETVLSTIVARAVQLSGLDGGVVFEYDEAAEEFIQRVATETGGALAEVRRTTRFRKGEGVLGRTAITLEPVQVPDITLPGAYESRLRENLIESGIRAILAVPMVREERLIGCLAVTRNQVGQFPTETIELLQTFATQSALAIQNARLFREIEDKSRQLEVASQHKSEFLANMSHELRTPLNAIIGFSEVLSERMFGDLNEKQEEYLKDICASGTHLLSLINDILDLSKIEAGRMELELTDFHLPTALDNALTLVRERAGRRGIALQMKVDDRLGQIQADERKMRQVVLNLLSNAIKFTSEGGRIEVGAEPKDGFVEVSVSDTGIGIAPEDQEKVFEEFRQVGTAAKKVEGTGLGLALCRKFVELHGGRIWVKSQVGQGSTFTFTIPVRRGK